LRVEKLVSFLGQRRNDIILGLTNEDISGSKDGHPDWGVLGYAEGRTCVLSTYRMGKDPSVRQQRLGKAAVHEIGHLIGLGHCATSGCLMADARGKLSTLDGALDMCSKCKVKAGIMDWRESVFGTTEVSEEEMTMDPTGISGVGALPPIDRIALQRKTTTPYRSVDSDSYIPQSVTLAASLSADINWRMAALPPWGEFIPDTLLVNGTVVAGGNWVRNYRYRYGGPLVLRDLGTGPIQAPRGSLLQAVYVARKRGNYVTPGEVTLQGETSSRVSNAAQGQGVRKRLTSVRQTPIFTRSTPMPSLRPVASFASIGMGAIARKAEKMARSTVEWADEE